MNLQTRRSFLATASTAAFPFILPSGIRAAETKPNNLITMAFIGMGPQNRQTMQNFLGMPVKVLAVCDVDTNRRNDAVNRVKKFHEENPAKGAFACKGYNDFREIMARNDIDAVCVGTPDHWHALITLAALESGKDVYCEKPLTHNIREALAVMKSAKRNNRVVQTGSQQRSMSEFRVACELIHNGVIGKIQRVVCKVGPPARPCDLTEEPMEPGLDWNLWLGPAAKRPYNSVLSPRGVHGGFPDWRSYAEFGGGQICDFGAHHFDIAQWGLGMDQTSPVEVRPPDDKEALTGAVITYENGVTVTQSDGKDLKTGGLRFYGSDGEIEVDRGSFEITHDGETINHFGRAEQLYLSDAKIRFPRNPSHAHDFLARIADRKRTVASEIEGGHTAIFCHLVNLAYYHRKTIKWDPRKMNFADPACDPKWLTREYRAPWKV